MPYQDEPGAYWALLSDEIEFRRTDYDLDEAARLIAATGVPESDGLIGILRRPPSSEEASTHFEAVAAARAKG